MELELAFPGVALILCPIMGALIAYIFYRKENNLKDVNLFYKSSLFFLRFLTLSFLFFLLFKPVVKQEKKNIEQPIVILAHDISESITMGKDSSFYKKEYIEKLNKLSENLATKFEVKEYSFGVDIKDGIDTVYDEQVTDVSNVFLQLNNNYLHQNVAAVILSSDGIYNKGSNPIYSISQLDAPVHCIALGDTTLKKDILINNVRHNQISYLGNFFPVEVTILAHGYKGKKTKCDILFKEELLDSRIIEITENNNESFTLDFLIEAKEEGIQEYRIKLKGLDNEFTYKNNSSDIFIDILETKQEILILSEFPHPDLGALKNAIASKEEYKVTSKLIENFNGNFNPYNLVVTYQLPSKNSHFLLFDSLKERSIPFFNIIGQNTSLSMFNQIQESIQTLNTKEKDIDVVYPDLNDKFTLFSIPDNYKDFVSSLPPLISPFTDFKLSPSANILLYQKIGSIISEKPLLLFTVLDNQKAAFLFGEGIWQWRLFEYSQNESHSLFNNIITSIVQYLSSKEDKSRFKIKGAKSFLENESIVFTAELYNQSYQPITNANIIIELKNNKGDEYPFTFTPHNKDYYLDAGNLLPGIYTFTASTQYGNENFKKKGSIKVLPLNIENINTLANHNLLFSLAKNTNGSFYYPNQLDILSEELLSNTELKSTYYFSTMFEDLINKKIIFIILLFLLTLEWFIRKYLGFI